MRRDTTFLSATESRVVDTFQRVNRRCREVSGAAGLSILKPAVQQQQRAGTCATRTTDILSPDTCLRRRWMPGWS